MATALKPIADDMTAEARQSYIGATDGATIVGLNPHKSSYRLSLEKTGVLEPEDLSDKWAVKRGTLIEPIIRAEHAESSGRKILASRLTYVHDKYPFLRCHIDGRFIGDPRGTGLFEAKTAGHHVATSEAWGEGDDEYPAQYHVQVQFMFAITGWTWGELVAWLDTLGKKVYPLKADPQIGASIIEKCVDWWHNVQAGNLDHLSRTTDDAFAQFPRATEGKAFEADADLLRAVHEIKELQSSTNASIEKLENLKGFVETKMGDAETLTYHGLTLATYKNAKRTTKIYPAEVAFTEKVTPYRVFRVSEAKLA